MTDAYVSPRLRRAAMDESTALLLGRALESLAIERSRRINEARYRPEGEAMFHESNLRWIREWVTQ